MTLVYVVRVGQHVWMTVSLRRLAAIITVLSESESLTHPVIETREATPQDLKGLDLS